jgi:putative spermidine/putrescine transport system permease protein
MAETTPVTKGVNGTLASLGARVGSWARRRIVWLLVAPAVILVLGYITVPMIYMVRMSFYVRERLEVYQPGTFTIANYTRFADSFLLRTTFDTLWYSAVILAATLLLGYPVAYMLTRTRSKWRPLLLAMVIAPFMISVAVSAYGWLTLLSGQGPVNWVLKMFPFLPDGVRMANTPMGGLIAMSASFIPFMVLPLVSSLSSVDRDLEEASTNLGANPIQTFFRVVFPLSLPGVMGGSALVSIIALTSFVTPRVVGGPGMSMLGVDVYNNTVVYLNWPQGAAVGIVLTVMVVLVFLLLGKTLRSQFLEEERAQ